VSEALMRQSLVRMPQILLGHLSTWIPRCSAATAGKRAVRLAIIPSRKRGRPFYHPLQAFLSEARCLLWVTLRPGKACTANGCIELTSAGPSALAVRASRGLNLNRCGILSDPFCDISESQDLPYITSSWPV
jgi:hypothetical protein